jgi:hypothetical protein
MSISFTVTLYYADFSCFNLLLLEQGQSSQYTDLATGWRILGSSPGRDMSFGFLQSAQNGSGA